MAKRPLRIADVLGFAAAPQRNLTQQYARTASQPMPRSSGAVKADKGTVSRRIAQAITPNTRLGNEYANKIASLLDMITITGAEEPAVQARGALGRGDYGQALGQGILAIASAVPGVGSGAGKSVKIGNKLFKNFPASEDEYIKAINPGLVRIADEARPNLGMGDMYGMAPQSAKKIKSTNVKGFGNVDFVSDGENVYALGYNPDLGEVDVLGYAMQRGDDTTELAVANELQGMGIGSELSYLYRSMNPMAKSGGLTEGGEKAARKAYRRMIGEK